MHLGAEISLRCTEICHSTNTGGSVTADVLKRRYMHPVDFELMDASAMIFLVVFLPVTCVTDTYPPASSRESDPVPLLSIARTKHYYVRSGIPGHLMPPGIGRGIASEDSQLGSVSHGYSVASSASRSDKVTFLHVAHDHRKSKGTTDPQLRSLVRLLRIPCTSIQRTYVSNRYTCWYSNIGTTISDSCFIRQCCGLHLRLEHAFTVRSETVGTVSVLVDTTLPIVMYVAALVTFLVERVVVSTLKLPANKNTGGALLLNLCCEDIPLFVAHFSDSQLFHSQIPNYLRASIMQISDTNLISSPSSTAYAPSRLHYPPNIPSPYASHSTDMLRSDSPPPSHQMLL
jgi:hypothetical protein